MKFLDKLDAAVTKNDSLVCVGLDPDLDKLPEIHKKSATPLFEFNKSIIDATHDLVCCYKPNSAFYETLGSKGIDQLRQTCDYIKQNYPDVPIILDAKRGDIGNTNKKYAEFAFEYLSADGITLQPYMGGEAITPFFKYHEKGLFILAKTSNQGSNEFQTLKAANRNIYEHVIDKFLKEWNKNQNIFFVAGATFPEELALIRNLVGSAPLLVPGIGAQAGNIEETLRAGLNRERKGLIINSSRGIIYADNPGEAASNLKDQINQYR